MTDYLLLPIPKGLPSEAPQYKWAIVLNKKGVDFSDYRAFMLQTVGLFYFNHQEAHTDFVDLLSPKAILARLAEKADPSWEVIGGISPTKTIHDASGKVIATISSDVYWSLFGRP